MSLARRLLLPVQLCSFILLFFTLRPAAALQVRQDPRPEIYNNSDRYKYAGCYAETTDIPDSAGERALAGGKNKLFPGNMTVPMCFSFCGTGPYKFVGLEYAR